MRRRDRGQALVEFALVAPMLLGLIMVVLDFGRGFFFYTQMAAGAREAARQAVLQSNQYSNTAPPALGCSGACQTPGVMAIVETLNAFGFPVVYSDSTSASSPPSYGTCSGGGATGPATCALGSSAGLDRVYVFIYQYGPATANPAGGPHFSCPTCSGGTGVPRTGQHDLVVVDLKMRFQPVTLSFLGLGWNLTFDAQTVEREEW